VTSRPPPPSAVLCAVLYGYVTLIKLKITTYLKRTTAAV